MSQEHANSPQTHNPAGRAIGQFLAPFLANPLAELASNRLGVSGVGGLLAIGTIGLGPQTPIEPQQFHPDELHGPLAKRWTLVQTPWPWD